MGTTQWSEARPVSLPKVPLQNLIPEDSTALKSPSLGIVAPPSLQDKIRSPPLSSPPSLVTAAGADHSSTFCLLMNWRNASVKSDFPTRKSGSKMHFSYQGSFPGSPVCHKDLHAGLKYGKGLSVEVS